MSRTSHDPLTIAAHGNGRERAAQQVQKELETLMAGHTRLQGPSLVHKQNAYAQCCIKLSNDLQREIFTDEKEGFKGRLSDQKIKIESLEDKGDQIEAMVAQKEQEISRLKKELAAAYNNSQTLGRTNEAMQNQLVKLNTHEGQYVHSIHT